MAMLNRLYKSINARIIQPNVQKHFEKTEYGKTIKSYKDKYKAKRCFLIGNGPSLKAEDLTKLHNNGDISFAFNRVYNIFDDTEWRPTFYISQDEKMLFGCQDVVNTLDLSVKFVPIQLNWYHDIEIKDATYFNIKPQISENPEDYQFSDNISKQIYHSGTGMYTAAQIAAYMGFSEIYFIGVDHHFQTSINNKGEIVVDNSVKDYFNDKYNTDKDNLYIPNTEKSTLTYVAMKKHCDERNIKVFNATRGGKLEVFPRVDFDSLF